VIDKSTRAKRKIPTNRVRARVKKKIKRAAKSSREVTANEVVQNLLNLLEHLGLDVSHLVSHVADIGKIKAASHTLYPYASAIGELLTIWHQNSEYLDNLGNPISIKLRGPAPSFHSLAQHAVPNMDESYLLSELERLGAVTIEADKLVQVHMRSFPVYEDKRLAIQHTLATLDDFIGTLRHNLNSAPSNSDQLFHRLAWNGDFDGREIPALKIRMKRHGQNFLESFDDWLMRKTISGTRKQNSRVKRTAVSIGVYLSVKET
jgi:hypothetical protein